MKRDSFYIAGMLLAFAAGYTWQAPSAQTIAPPAALPPTASLIQSHPLPCTVGSYSSNGVQPVRNGDKPRFLTQQGELDYPALRAFENESRHNSNPGLYYQALLNLPANLPEKKELLFAALQEILPAPNSNKQIIQNILPQLHAMQRKLPTDTTLQSMLIETLAAQGENAAAVEQAQQGLQRDPNNAFLHYRSGLLLRTLQRDSEADYHLGMAAMLSEDYRNLLQK